MVMICGVTISIQGEGGGEGSGFFKRRRRECFWVCGGFQVKKTACNQRNGILYAGFFSNDRSVCLSFLFFFNMHQGDVYFYNIFLKCLLNYFLFKNFMRYILMIFI